eukprot:174584-Chlamydomonas_euryale.AAC.1
MKEERRGRRGRVGVGVGVDAGGRGARGAACNRMGRSALRGPPVHGHVACAQTCRLCADMSRIKWSTRGAGLHAAGVVDARLCQQRHSRLLALAGCQLHRTPAFVAWIVCRVHRICLGVVGAMHSMA